MRILLLTHYFEPENGAPQRRWRALIDRFLDAGHHVDVLCPPPHYPSGRLSDRGYRTGSVGIGTAGERVFRVGYLPHDGRIASRTMDHLFAAADSLRRSLRLASRHVLEPDVVVATAPALESLIAGGVLSRRLSVPLVAEMRDAWPDLVAHTPGLIAPVGPTSVVKRWVHEFVTRMQRGADAVVTTTETFATVLRARGITDVTVLRNGTEAARYETIDSSVPSRSGLRVLYMGTIGRSQGLDKIIEAAARLRADGVEVEVRIIGHGADVGRLRKLNARLGKPVEILGQIDRSRVEAQYVWADTTVVSLRDWEPFMWTVPSKLYELLAAGKHITAVVAGEAADIVRAARAGDVIPPGDAEAIAVRWRALAEDRRRLSVGEHGRRWVRQHADYDRIAAEYLEVLERVVQDRAAARQATR